MRAITTSDGSYRAPASSSPFAEEAAQVLTPHHRGMLIALLATSAGTARRLGRKPESGADSVSDHPLRMMSVPQRADRSRPGDERPVR